MRHGVAPWGEGEGVPPAYPVPGSTRRTIGIVQGEWVSQMVPSRINLRTACIALLSCGWVLDLTDTRTRKDEKKIFKKSDLELL